MPSGSRGAPTWPATVSHEGLQDQAGGVQASLQVRETETTVADTGEGSMAHVSGGDGRQAGEASRTLPLLGVAPGPRPIPTGPRLNANVRRGGTSA